MLRKVLLRGRMARRDFHVCLLVSAKICAEYSNYEMPSESVAAGEKIIQPLSKSGRFEMGQKMIIRPYYL